MTNKEVPMVNAPDWYGTHLDKLDFEWGKEEELEIERYAEKILKNISEEDMTPLDRFKAHVWARPEDTKNADRKLLGVFTAIVYCVRTLDGYADALKPIDLFRNPKLMVKAELATVARFREDFPSVANISYTEDLWGGRAKLIDYGNPSPIGEPAVKTMEDLERLKKMPLPDPFSGGLYPGWLWYNREMRRVFTKYKIPMPIWASI